MNKNPFAPEVPCHRVVKSNGELGGFADDKTLSYESSDTNYRTRKPGAC
jgi:O6-methylguanine-DNA--protein-cysteine methyltransferase